MLCCVDFQTLKQHQLLWHIQYHCLKLVCTCSDSDDKNEKNYSEFSGTVGCIVEQEQMEMDVSGARLVCCCDTATALVWFGLVWFGLVWYGKLE